MGFNNNIGGGMNITIQLGGTPPDPSGGTGGFLSFQPRFDSAKERLDNNKGDSDALKDLRSLKKDVDSTLQKEQAKECGGNMSQQEMMEKLLGMIMQLLQQVLGGGDEEGEGDGEGEGEGNGAGKPGGRPDTKGPQLTITIPLT